MEMVSQECIYLWITLIYVSIKKEVSGCESERSSSRENQQRGEWNELGFNGGTDRSRAAGRPFYRPMAVVEEKAA